MGRRRPGWARAIKGKPEDGWPGALEAAISLAPCRSSPVRHCSGYGCSRANLAVVIQFCENFQDCRRVQQLRYFGENFDSALCDNGCDVCKSGMVYADADVTAEARAMVSIAEVRRRARPLHVCGCASPFGRSLVLRQGQTLR